MKEQLKKMAKKVEIAFNHVRDSKWTIEINGFNLQIDKQLAHIYFKLRKQAVAHQNHLTPKWKEKTIILQNFLSKFMF